MTERLIHHPEYVRGIVSGEGYSLCGGQFPGRCLSIVLGDFTCPECKFKWFLVNKHKMKNLPADGNPLVHYRVQLYNDDWVATCGVLESKEHHVLGTKDPLFITCDDCRDEEMRQHNKDVEKR